MLLVRHVEGDLWTTPGGMIEPEETPANAAVREAWEETGLVVELVRIVGVFGGERCTSTYANGDRIAWVSTVFEARVIGGTLRPDQRGNAGGALLSASTKCAISRASRMSTCSSTRR